MLNHLYIDNFRCFVNFEWKPGRLSLLLGDNGNGKSSVFEVVEGLRDFLTSSTMTQAAFPTHTLTAWDSRREQTFELGIFGNGGQYLYRLVVEHKAELFVSRVLREELMYDGDPLYRFEGGEAHLFRDDGSKGPVFPHDWSRSAISTIPGRHDNQKLFWFRDRVRHMYVLSPVPQTMSFVSESEVGVPDRQLRDYVSWLRYLSNDLTFPARLVEALKPVMEGLGGMRFDPAGETAKALVFLFDYGGKAGSRKGGGTAVKFDRLSDGQRCLAALYTGLLVAEKKEESTFLWDEPDNYVSLREIEPWLTAVRDLAENDGRQCLLISHHPELINTLAVENGAHIYRDEEGPARVKAFSPDCGGITPAEIVARGWED